jgi:hypothetical protein
MMMMKRAILMSILMLTVVFVPTISGEVTETKFTNGLSSSTHIFTGTGNSNAGEISIPYGAVVTDSQFTMTGVPASESYGNLSTDSDFGGVGSNSWQNTPPGFNYGYRYNLESTLDSISLKGQTSIGSYPLEKAGDISSTTGFHNTTGEFVANGDQGYSGLTEKKSSLSVDTSAAWNYPGPVTFDENEVHVLHWSTTSFTTAPAVMRFNRSTGDYEGAANLAINTCHFGADYYLYDVTNGGEGVMWTVSYNYEVIAKWTLNAAKTTWNCDSSWQMSYPFQPAGIDIDEDTGEMYLYVYESNFQANYPRHLYQVSTSNPLNIQQQWNLGDADDYKLSSSNGLVVNLPLIITGEYSSSKSNHHYHNLIGGFIERMGFQEFSGTPHYGMEQSEDGKLAFTCYYKSTCTAKVHEILQYGDGSVTDARIPSSSMSTVTSPTKFLSLAIDRVKLSALVGFIPSQTSIELSVSNDGGGTWQSILPEQTISFPTSGTQLRWKAWLNGSASVTPILDLVNLEYTSSYSSSGYFYLRTLSFTQQSMPAAMTIHYNATIPASTTFTVELRQGSTSTVNAIQFADGDTNAITLTSGYLYVYVTYISGSARTQTPMLHDINITFHNDAPQEAAIDIGSDGSKEWKSSGTFIGTSTLNENDFDDAFNSLIPNSGSGFENISIDISSKSSGILILESFSVTYVMNTINLDISFPEGEILHSRDAPYEIITRHIIGENANDISSATLSFKANPVGLAPTLEWDSTDGFAEPNDPDSWIDTSADHSFTREINGMLEIHWIFEVTSNFAEQENVLFTVDCLDDSGNAGISPIALTSATGMRVNQSYGMGWMKVRDNFGEMTREDVATGEWVAAGEDLLFQGALWFSDSVDAPKDDAFDIRISQDGYVCTNCRDNTNFNGSFSLQVQVPNSNNEEGVVYEIQTYNERDSTLVLPINDNWRRVLKVDATPPQILSVYPNDESYEAASYLQTVAIEVVDAVGDPQQLQLYYWVESTHDLNLNGEADAEEYVMKTVTNTTDADTKWFMTTIDHSMNPNMGRVSYYWDGGDRAGNSLYHTAITGDGPVNYENGPGFDYDDATFRTRKDSSAIFTGLIWQGHEDNQPIYAGTPQSISLGLIDANTVIDFEYISLIFDFEGPDPEKDRQTISYSGTQDIFWSESDYITMSPTSTVSQTTTETGMPLIGVNMDFTIGWDWPDEEISDLVLEFKERGAVNPTRYIIYEHTFTVENDLVLSANDFLVEDISEPRTGLIADGSRVRNDDRIEFTGRVVYEGSNIPAPRDQSIIIEVFDGERMWTDGSLSADGGYTIEVPLSGAASLANSPTRTCLISIKEIPGNGQDMTGQSISTTLRMIVDDTAPRVVSRTSPVNIIDISSTTDLTAVPVEFKGSEDADMTGSEQQVHWVMRDASRTMTIGAGSSVLGMLQDGQSVNWTATVDLTNGGEITPREGDWIGFYLTGWDAAGNEFPIISNSEASPIAEIASADNDFERQWIRLGAVGAELSVISIKMDDNHLSPGQEVAIQAEIMNTGGPTTTQFKVAFYQGDSSEPFATSTLNKIESGEILVVSALWTSVEGIDRIRVVVDSDNDIVEVNDDDNSAEHNVEIAYSAYLGWLDSPRENPLIWLFVIITLLAVTGIAVTASKTAITMNPDGLLDDEDWDEEEEEQHEDEYEDL